MLLILIYPLPFVYEISGFFSFLTAKTAAYLLHICFPSVVINGIAITIPPDIKFSIGINCSGVNSMLALVTIIILWLVVIKHKSKVNYIMLCSAISIGFITNVFRIVCIFIIARSFGMDSAIKIWHDFAAYFFYIISLSFLFVIWWVLYNITNQTFRLRRLVI